MENFPFSISSFLMPSVPSWVLFFVFISSFTSAKELILQGKLGEKPLIQFTPAESEIKLVCDLNDVDPSNMSKAKWSFWRHGDKNVSGVELSCKKNISSKNDNSLIKSGCDVTFDKEHSQLILRLDDISKDEFGHYVCHTGNLSASSKTFILKELVHLSRKGEKNKVQKSVTVTVGDTLYIYCNETGLHREHKISWVRDGEDITEQLNNATGIFENFTKSGELMFYGDALLQHRGNYTCQVNLKTDDDSELQQYYPVEFAFFVRVKEWDVWTLPVYILLGEIVVIGVFTLILNWREKRMEDDDSIVYEDSEDEDDVQNPSKNGTGTQNNNSNGK